jgi:uncharacterized protein (DUF1330 family)
MSATVIATVEIHDEAGIREYIQHAGPLLQRFGARVVGYADHPDVLEGEWPGSRTMVLEFESEAAARTWYESEEYQAAAEIRRRASTTAMVLLPTPPIEDWK